MTDLETTDSAQPSQLTDVPGVPVPDRIAAVDAELAALDAKSAADPVTGAADLDQWRTRDTHRRDRSAQLVQRRRDLQEFGALLDDHDGPIRAYLGAAAELRHQYAELSQARTFGGVEAVPVQYRSGRRDLTRWATALGALGNALPAGDDDARAYLAGQWSLWFAARDGWCRAQLALHVGLLPHPEVGLEAALPPGVGYGVHLLADATARQARYRGAGSGRVQSFHEYLTDPTQDPDGGLQHHGRVQR